jgi:hypothetical protein
MSEDAPTRLLQEASLQALTQIRDEVQSLFSRYGAEPHAVTQTLKNLFWYLSSRSQTVSFLISHGYSWDAEIILRPFYEAAAKILFICFAEENDKPALVDEFWNKLGPINNRRTARKAAFAEQLFEKESLSTSVLAMMRDERVFDLHTEGSRAQRKRLEKKWSFAEIVENLDERATEGRPVKGVKSMLHIYGMASHLIHADQAAMDLMHDRATRGPHERNILEAGHVSRIMSDQVSITWFCADALREHFRGDFTNNAKILEAVNRTLKLGKRFQTAFEDSQRSFYARWVGDVD